MHTPEQPLPIRLAAFTFDPVEERARPARGVAHRKRSRRARPLHLQFVKSLTRDERARVQGQYGLKLTDYIPELAYSERLSTQTLEAPQPGAHTAVWPFI
jgi:hypothetical protein